MAEKIIPFAHTVLLPSGSPAIGCVDAVRLDLSGVKIRYTGDACYCLGDADVLIEYHAAPLEPASLFAAPPTSGRPWQALLSLAWEMAGPAGGDSSAPPKGSYQPELRELEWFIVASNALELEGSFAIVWDDPAAIQAAAAPSAAQRNEAPDFVPASPQLITAPAAAPADTLSRPDLTQDMEQEIDYPDEPDVMGDVRQEEQLAHKEAAADIDEAALGLIWRPQAYKRSDKQGYQSFRGWTMVTYQEEDSRKQELSKELSMEQQIQQLAEKAEDTIEEAQRLWLDIEKQKREQIMPLAENTAEDKPETSPEIMTAGTMPVATEQVSAMEAATEPAAAHTAQHREEMQPPQVSLDEEQLRQVVSQSLAEEPEPDDEEDREQDLREGVVVRMRFDQANSGGQKRIYYPGPASEFSAAPKTLAETLQEALGEEQPQPTAKINFGWVDKDPTLDSPAENDEKIGLDSADAVIKQEDVREEKGDEAEEKEGAVLTDTPDAEYQRAEPGITETLAEQSEGIEEQATEQAAKPELTKTIYDEIETTQSQAKTTVDEKSAASSAAPEQNTAEKREAIAAENDTSTGDREKAIPMAAAAGAEEEPISAKAENLPTRGIPEAKPTEAESLEAAQYRKSATGSEATKKDAQPVAGQKTALAETKSAPEAPPRVEIDPQAIEEALDTALEPELLPPAEKRSRRRRAVGLPRLNIDARDNNVEISAFNLQIKL